MQRLMAGGSCGIIIAVILVASGKDFRGRGRWPPCRARAALRGGWTGAAGWTWAAGWTSSARPGHWERPGNRAGALILVAEKKYLARKI